MDYEQHRLGLAVALLAGFLGGQFSMLLFESVPVFAQKAPQEKKIITAEEFGLLDKSVKARIKILIRSDGGPSISLMDVNGKPRFAVGLLPDGNPVLSLYDENDRAGALLDLLADGSTGLGLVDKNGRPRARFGLLPNGDPGMSLMAVDGKVIWTVP